MRRSVCRDTTKVFCPFCGSPSLKRVQAFFTSDGIVGIGDFPFLLDKEGLRVLCLFLNTCCLWLTQTITLVISFT